jgi:hypothetical protein
MQVIQVSTNSAMHCAKAVGAYFKQRGNASLGYKLAKAGAYCDFSTAANILQCRKSSAA